MRLQPLLVKRCKVSSSGWRSVAISSFSFVRRGKSTSFALRFFPIGRPWGARQAPTRLLSAFPAGVVIRRVGLAQAVKETRDFLAEPLTA